VNPIRDEAPRRGAPPHAGCCARRCAAHNSAIAVSANRRSFIKRNFLGAVTYQANLPRSSTAQAEKPETVQAGPRKSHSALSGLEPFLAACVKGAVPRLGWVDGFPTCSPTSQTKGRGRWRTQVSGPHGTENMARARPNPTAAEERPPISNAGDWAGRAHLTLRQRFDNDLCSPMSSWL
jgi:hypothetical protein